MSSTDDKKPMVNPLEMKIDAILAAMQNFGLNFIQKIGELKHELTVLSDQVEKMNKALITVKGLEPKMDEITSMKHDLMTELHYLQSQVKAVSFKNSDMIKMKSEDESSLHLEGLKAFQQNLRNYTSASTLAQDLEEVKKKIFEIIGGHRVLFEIGETIKQFYKLDTLSESDYQILDEKITFWMNKLKK